jgi:hypothetical protein
MLMAVIAANSGHRAAIVADAAILSTSLTFARLEYINVNRPIIAATTKYAIIKQSPPYKQPDLTLARLPRIT